MNLQFPKNKPAYLSSNKTERSNLAESVRLLGIAARLPGHESCQDAAGVIQGLLDELNAAVANQQAKLPVTGGSPGELDDSAPW